MTPLGKTMRQVAMAAIAILVLGPITFVGCAGTPSSPSPMPVLNSLQPAQGPVGTSIAILGAGLTGAMSVEFGVSAYTTLTVMSDKAVVFVAPRTTNPCGISNTPCGAGTAALITPGVYNVAVTTTNGKSNTLGFTIVP